MPHVSVDAITVGVEMIQALQTIVSRKLAPSSGAVVSITEFFSYGQRNALPGTATLKGDVRARLPQDRKDIERLMRQIADGIAIAHGVGAKVAFNTEFIETTNAPAPTEGVVQAAKNAGLEVIGDRPP